MITSNSHQIISVIKKPSDAKSIDCKAGVKHEVKFVIASHRDKQPGEEDFDLIASDLDDELCELDEGM